MSENGLLGLLVVKRGDGAAGDGVEDDEGEEVDEGVPEVEDIGIVVLSMSLGLC